MAWSSKNNAGKAAINHVNCVGCVDIFYLLQPNRADYRFQGLLHFQQEHGHLLVPKCYPSNPKLAQWVKRQKHNSILTDGHEEKLLAVGFIFDSDRAAWYERFETLKSFYLAHGHYGIPANFEYHSLNEWIQHQRCQYQLYMNGEKSSMTKERTTALNSIGFDWNPRN
ncbi:helicase domain protein [Nitzschia inconspicua]|uniref:Helicase domain protein n=1 Tax=Nitzschia inconspicua TaxID=303405 RepID=A0A9K3PAW2_9STRA|nr:helicase domain protein [Nitzschia inconspicua]